MSNVRWLRRKAYGLIATNKKKKSQKKKKRKKKAKKKKNENGTENLKGNMRTKVSFKNYDPVSKAVLSTFRSLFSLRTAAEPAFCSKINFYLKSFSLPNCLYFFTDFFFLYIFERFLFFFYFLFFFLIFNSSFYFIKVFDFWVAVSIT